MENLKNISKTVENELPENEFSLYIEEILGEHIHCGIGYPTHCGVHKNG